ncbi:hypothetical protein AAG906_037205 [Vitis piasezkii]
MPISPISGREAHQSGAFKAILPLDTEGKDEYDSKRKRRNCCGPHQYANALTPSARTNGKGPRPIDGTIIFPPVDPTRTLQPHRDALILSLDIGDYDVRRILVDPGSSADLVQASVVSHMGHSLAGLENPGRILSGFNGSSTTSLGDIILPVQAGPVTLNTLPPDRQKVIRNEIDKLLEAGFIREVSYPDWLANVVVVPKKEGKWRVCFPFATNRSNCGFHYRARDALFLGCLLRISPNSHVPTDEEKTDS